MTNRSENRLRRGALGTIVVAGMAAVLMSPALGLYFNWGAMAIETGRIGPLVYLVAMLISIPTAYCYASVAREIPSAGQAYTWLWRAIGARAGFWTGIVLSIFYMSTVWLVSVMFSLFFHDFLRYVGLETGVFGNVVGVLIALSFVGYIAYRDITFNSKVSIGFLLFETFVVFALGILIIIIQLGRGEASLEPFSPGAATAGLDGFRAALIFGVLSFIGFDYAAVLAEETRTPRRSVPAAVLMSVIFVGLFWVVVSYFLSISVPMSDIESFVNEGFTPVTPIAERYLGLGSLIVILTGLSAALGNLTVAVPSAARVLYAMGRDGSYPRSLGRTNPRYQTP